MMKEGQDNKPRFVKRSPLVVGEEYVNLLKGLKERFRRSQVKAAVKVNSTLLEFYWDMGREISRLRADAKYGSAFFDSLSLDLKTEFPGQTVVFLRQIFAMHSGGISFIISNMKFFTNLVKNLRYH